MAGVILVPSEHAATEMSDGEERMDAAPKPMEVTRPAVAGSTSQTDLGGLQAALEDQQDGSATVRRLGLSKISDKPSLFRELDELLAFDHHRVRSECAGMIARIAPQLGSELEACMAIVMPHLVHNLGHFDPDVREAAANAIVVHLKHTEDELPVLQAVVKHGLLNSDAALKREVTRHLRLLYDPELANKDWREIIRCLIFLVVRHEDTKEEALQALQELRNLVGDEQFRQDLQQMDARDKEEASILLNTPNGPEAQKYEFSFVDPTVAQMLQDKTDWKARVRGIEELKLNVKKISDPGAILEEVPRFLEFLAELLNDGNFKVTLVTLEIYAVLMDKLKWRVKPHLKSVVDTLVQHLGGNKIVVRSQAAKVLHGLMHSVGPAPVASMLCLNLTSPGRFQTTKMREEVLNAIILALLTFPSYEFDLREICFAVAPALLDPKCRVRHVALECMAVLAQAMGSSKLATIATALDEAAKPYHDTEGALAAVLARLARRQLPRIAADGQVEYSLRIPSSNTSRTSQRMMASAPRGADVDWILAGTGSLGSGSASSRNTPVPPNSEQGAGKNQSASFPSSPAAPRRIVSPGHNKNWPPWSDTGGNLRSFSSGNLSDKLPAAPDAIPATWKVRPQSKGRRAESGSGRHRTSTPEPAVANANNLQDSSSPQTQKNQGASHGMIYPSKQPTADRGSIGGSSRPLDKVAAMLGNNILPSKLHPVLSDNTRDKSARSLGGTSIVPLQSIPNFNPSNTWPGPAPGSLPELPQRKKVLGPITDLRDAPIPMRPKLVRSSSGSRRARVPPIGQSSLNGTPDTLPDNEQQANPNSHPSPKKAGRGEPQRNFNSSQFGNVYPGTASFTQLPDPEPLRTTNGHTDNLGGRNSVAGNRQGTNYSPPLLPSLNGSSPSKSSISLINHEMNSDDEEKPLDEYSRARGSVDSGVESLARPRSRMSSRSRVVRPRSLDLHSTFSMHPAHSYEILKVNADLSPSDSESPGWYDEDKGVQNRAISEVSSLTSSLEQLPDSPDDRIIAPSRFALYERTRKDNLHDADGKPNGLRAKTRQGSSLSWDLKSSSPTPLKQPNNNRSISSFALHGDPQEEEGKIHLDGPPTYRRKPVPIYSPPLHPKQADPVVTQAPFISGGPGLRRGALSTNGYLIAPRARTDHVLISSSLDASPGSEDINVVGKGVNPKRDTSSVPEPSLPTSPPVPAHRSNLDSNANPNPSHVRLPAVQGTRLAHNRNDSVDGNLSTEEEDPNAMSLSRSTFNKMMSRKMEMMKEAERRKHDRQQKLQEQRRIWLQEQETKKSELEEKQKNGQPNFRPKTPPGKPAATRRKARITPPPAQNGSAALSASTKSLVSNDERLMRNPDEALRTALNNMQSDEWNVKCNGIKIISQLTQQQPAALNNELHAVNLALLAEVKNLRSSVSRAAIQAFSLLFASAKKNMENDLEMICRTLLHKSGESNVFIKEDVEKALTQMVENVSPQKAVIALILGGATHRNAAVRKTASQFLAMACEKLGANKILIGTKDVTDKVVPTAAQFLMDGSPLTRYYGRKIIFMLLDHPEFDRVLRQHVQPNTLRNIQDILDGLKTKGLGSLPLNESASSRHFKGAK